MIWAWRSVFYALIGRRQIVWRVLILIILFKADGKFEMFSRDEDQKILTVLKRMDKSERDKTEIAGFITPEGDYRVFLLYPDGRYQDMTGKQIDRLEAGV